MKRWCSVVCALLLWASKAAAGPPYATDDPEPVEYQHFEMYFASESLHERGGWEGTAPHLEVNYGPLPDVQLAVRAPLVFAIPQHGPSEYGYGDTELGVKWRFIEEGDAIPMVAIYPLLELPTGSRSAGLGSGNTQLFIPLWVQKSFGRDQEWQTHGGLGAWLDFATRGRPWWYFGWQLQRQMCSWLTLGVEVFYGTPPLRGDPSDARFNVGAVIDFTEVQHLVVSAGRGFTGPSLFQSFIAYELTFGVGPDERDSRVQPVTPLR